MENPPFEDVFPIENGDFPLLCLFTGGYRIQSLKVKHKFFELKNGGLEDDSQEEKSFFGYLPKKFFFWRVIHTLS